MSRNHVFAEPVTLELLGHVADAWSDDDRVTRGECSCGWTSGPFHDATNWHRMWCAHVKQAVLERRLASAWEYPR